MKKIYKYIACITMAAIVSGCSRSDIIQTDENSENEEVVIPVIYTMDPNSDIESMEQLVNDFNHQYKGTYKVDIEWYDAQTDNYRTLIKRLNVTDELPAIITDVAFLPSYFKLLIKDNRLVDVSSYILNDEEWMDSIENYIIEGYSEKDEAKYLSTLGTACFSSVGFFYNKELFAEAGISQFPTTWEEFFEVCNALEDKGITPLGLHTEGTAWAPMLIATAYVARTDEGVKFMNTVLPDSYSNTAGQDLTEMLSRIFEYTTEDAIGNDFDVAERHFLNGEVAILPNGFWELEQIPEGMKNQTGFAVFPGDIIIASPEMSGWAVANTYSEDVKDGAVEFLKFRTQRANEQKMNFIEDVENNANTVSGDYINVISSVENVIPNYQMQWNSILQQEVIGEILPKLISGEINENEFIEQMNKSVEEYNKEQ